jgi:hypothetical protein
MSAAKALVAGPLMLGIPVPAQEQPEQIMPPAWVRPVVDREHKLPATADTKRQLTALIAEQIRTRVVLLEVLTEIKQARAEMAGLSGHQRETAP